jgi:GMP synthase (glutamine-hydrolysing)
MKDVLIVKNIPREGPGLLGELLQEKRISFELIDLEAGDSIPAPIDYKAMVVLGGPDSANDTTPKMIDELEKIKQALDNNTPYLGICLGMQTLVKAAGGKVVKAENKEVGFIDPDGFQYDIQVTEEGKVSPLLAGLPHDLEVFHLHGETVQLTEQMKLLGTGKFCRNQIVQVNPTAYGIQSHFELTPEMLATWAEQDPDLIPLGKEELLANYEAIKANYTNIGRTILQNFLRIAGVLR